MRIALFALCMLVLPVLASPDAQADGAGEVIVRDIQTGDGDTAVDGSQLVVQYEGYLSDGTKFDSTFERGKPFIFSLGAAEVIRGWELGLKGMRVGGVRELIVPPALAYGERGAGKVIPPNATLRYMVELLRADPPVFSKIPPATLHSLIGAVTVIDIRTDAQRAETGTIKGAITLPAYDERGRLNRHFLAELKRTMKNDDTIVLIDTDGQRAGFLGTFLGQNAGFTDLRGLDGGVKAWIKQGYPLVK